MSLLTTPFAAVPARPAFRRVLRGAAVGRWSALALLGSLCGFLFFYGLGAGELYRTESLRAIIAAEFLRSGNWIVPTLYGEPLFTKPPGMYAAIAALSWPAGGVTEWTARLPSALAATLTVFLFYGCFGRLFGRQGGLVAAVILPTSFMWLDKASAAEIDTLQVAWVAAALLCFLRALEAVETSGEPGAASGLGWWLAALLCVAGGVLTKWTAPAFFYGTIVPLLWWRGRLRLLLTRNHLLSVALGAGICLAWVVAAAALAGWQTLYDTVSREALQRLSPRHHIRPYPWHETLGHPFVVLATNLPWSVFALLTLRPGFAHAWDERARRLLQAMHCWTWPNLLFWSLIPEHAPRHSFPLFPGLAGLAAFVWIGWLSGKRETRSAERSAARASYGQVLVGLLIAWLIVKVVFVEMVIPRRNRDREPLAKAGQIAALVPPSATLYLFRLKDEGIMFYFGRTVRRLPSPSELPSSTEPLYCILELSEWRRWNPTRPAEEVLSLFDEQGAPIVLVRVMGAETSAS